VDAIGAAAVLLVLLGDKAAYTTVVLRPLDVSIMLYVAENSLRIEKELFLCNTLCMAPKENALSTPWSCPTSCKLTDLSIRCIIAPEEATTNKFIK
jgi:hypothetical protein